MSERLDEYPDALQGEGQQQMPWEEERLPVWPWGQLAGTPLRDFSSATLLRKRHEVERKNGNGTYFDFLLAAIDQVLLERQGE